MRLDRLDLTRYGKFTDDVIDFGARPETGCDLHIVYGPNEAGKSTMFNAWLDLLFGIGAQSSYNFLHPYPNMKIGAAIHFDGESRDFVRIKRPQNSLFDGHDQQILEAALLAGLGGLDRDSYKTMFSLDDETLEKGGDDILASRGDLGELLFSASAGLSEFSERLEKIRTEAEEFYKPRAQKRVLGDLKAELVALKAERDLIDTQASDYARLTKIHGDATQRHAEASSERQRIRARLTTLNSLLSALPRLGELQSLFQQIEPLADLPDVAPEWREQIRDLSHEEATLAAGGAALIEEIRRLTEEKENIGVDHELLALSHRIAELDRLRTRHDTAEEDLPERRLALGRIEGRVEQLLARLGRTGETDAEHLLLDTATTASLRELVDTRASLDVRLVAAKKEERDAKAALDEARAQFREAGGDPENTVSGRGEAEIAALSGALAAMRNEDHGVRLKAAERAIIPAREKAEARLNAIAPWQGDATELRAMTPPSADTLREWKAKAEDLKRKLMKSDEEIERLSQAIKRLEAEADAISRTRSLPSSDQTEAFRASRDQAWNHHKSKLDPESAQTFEQAMAAFDKAADTRARHQAEVAKLNETTVQAAILGSDLEATATAKAKLEAEHEGLKGQIANAVTALSPRLSPDMTAQALEDWLSRRELALDADRELGLQIRELEDAERDRETATQRLLKALAPFEADVQAGADFEALVTRAQDLVSRQTRIDAHRQMLATQERAVKGRQLDLRTADEDLTAWMLSWKSACAGCWLGRSDVAPTAAEVREVLPLLSELSTAINERTGLADRIAKMQRDQTDYATALHSIAEQAGIETRDISVSGMSRQLAERLTSAQTDKSRHDAASEKIAEALARQRDHAEKQAAHSKQRTGILTALDTDSLTDASLRLDRALERKALSRRVDEIREQIRQGLGLGTFDEAQAQLTAADPEQLRHEKQELEATLETLDSDVQELYAARMRAADELAKVGGDDAVARIEQQRQTVLLAIAEGAERYLRVSAGIIAMEHALTLYRERHRSSMMARASDAVRTNSRGRYTGLASQPDKGRELLIAMQKDGTSKQAAEMSKGARFQLYLALRVAGFHEFAQTRPTVPFIADDIMETFDDFRAEEAFRLFADMACVGQVIYLTHHRHLCDIAKAVCPDVKIHELSA